MELYSLSVKQVSFYSIHPRWRRPCVLQAGAVVLCVAAVSVRGRPSALLEYPMNAEAIGDSGLVTVKAQMAFGGMEALQRQVDEMNINWGNKPTHVRQNFAESFGKMDALKKLVNHMETKNSDSGSSAFSATPDQALQAVMQPDAEDTGEQQQDSGVRASRKAALYQQGASGRAPRQRLNSLRMSHRRRQSGRRAVVLPPFMQGARRATYDPALNLSQVDRMRLAQRAAVRVGTGDWDKQDVVVSPPWTR